ALIRLGRAYGILGRPQQTIKFYQQWLDIARATGNRKEEADALLQLGVTYFGLNQVQQAIECYQQVLDIARQTGDREQEVSALMLLGSVSQLLGQNQQGIEYYQQLLSIAQQTGNREQEASALGYLSFGYIISGQYQQAIRLLQQQLDIARQAGDSKLEAMFIGLLGLSYELSGQDQQALGFYQQELDSAQQLGDSQAEASALIGLGRILLESGSLTEAEEALFAAIKIKESGFQSFLASVDDISSDIPSEFDSLKVSAFEADVNIYNRLQEALVFQNKIDAALEIAERGRARVFVNLLASRLSQNSNNQPIIEPLTIQQIKLIAREQNVTLVEYSIIDDAFKIQDRFKRRETKLFIWVIKPTGEVVFKQVDLKSLNTSLEDLVKSTRDSIGVRGRSIFNVSVVAKPEADQSQRLQQLHKLLIEPIAEFLPTNPSDRVVFIPQNELFLVPFPALKDDGGRYLIEKQTILTAPSIQVLQLTRLKRRGVTGTNVLVVGNPTMPSNLTTHTEEQIQLPPLPGAEKEALAIANLLNTQALTGNQATKLAITQQMEDAKIIHLATHGLLDDLKGQGVPGAIALAPSGKDDGLLTSSEILDIKLNAELVVLSACDTGRGDIKG
ncbi:MAG: CHAT domain-containing protein, partial [Coleofasciculus sp. Co-bin14]|nr:CHAT domain-containing protein [Coleofasciculus sp. Co-bin14]